MPSPSTVLAEHDAEIIELCRRYHVRTLDVFGSVARGTARPDSDVDFLVEFEPLPPGGYADAYFGLHESLEELLGTGVDLVVESAIRNQYFKESIGKSKRSLYAA